MADTIKDWLRGKDVLITGGTGFIGKGLIEKLLRTTEINRIYLIIRCKRNVSPAERWQQISQNLVFERLRRERPDAFNKVIVVGGNMTERGLGLCGNDKEELCNNVAIVFHSAACVRFDDPLSSAILLNVGGTKELLNLAKSMKKLECFQYVSTAYSTPKIKDKKIEETLYPQFHDWRTLIKMAECDGITMNILQDKIVTKHCNTYTFSKSAAETMIQEIKGDVPVAIFRPSAVSSILEPEPGWIDNLNGPISFWSGVSCGVIRVALCDADVCLDIVPIDIVINGMIVVAWVTSNNRSKCLDIYNCTYGDKFQISFREARNYNYEKILPKFPSKNDIWFPFMIFADNTYYYHFLFYCLNLVPGLLLDLLLIMYGKRPRLTTLNIKIYKSFKVVYYFSSQIIEFHTNNYKSIFNLIPKEETNIFYLNFDYKTPGDFLMEAHKGFKKFILKEKEEDLEKFKRKYWRLYYIDRFTKGVILAGLLWYINRFICTMIF